MIRLRFSTFSLKNWRGSDRYQTYVLVCNSSYSWHMQFNVVLTFDKLHRDIQSTDRRYLESYCSVTCVMDSPFSQQKRRASTMSTSNWRALSSPIGGHIPVVEPHDQTDAHDVLSSVKTVLCSRLGGGCSFCGPSTGGIRSVTGRWDYLAIGYADDVAIGFRDDTMNDLLLRRRCDD